MITKCHFLIGIVALAAFVAATGCQSTKSKRNKKASATMGSSRPGSTAPLGRSNSYSQVPTNAPVLALTFDDGPHPSNTPRLLDILRSHDVKATFYVTGENARRYPHILRRMTAEGHEIGNHTMSHGRITKMSQSQIRQEIGATNQAVHSATGRVPRSFRPPYGSTNEGLKSWIKSEFGMPSILWSVDPEDWKKPGVGVVTNRLVNGASRGGILLLHDIHAASIEATPGTLSQLKRRGYQFVTISQLIDLEPR